jgi:hypothetical protein
MANQAIALQARAPQGNILGPALQQGAQMVNMMRQQETADRQAAATNQQLGIARANEAREAALHPLRVSQTQASIDASRAAADASTIERRGKLIDQYSVRAGQALTPAAYDLMLKDLDKDAPEVAAQFRASMPVENFDRNMLLRMVGSISDNFKATFGPLETEVVVSPDGTLGVARTGGFGKPGVFELEEYKLAPPGAGTSPPPAAQRPSARPPANPMAAAPMPGPNTNPVGGAPLNIQSGNMFKPASMRTGPPMGGAQPDIKSIVNEAMSSRQISQSNLQMIRDVAGPDKDAQLIQLLKAENIRIVPDAQTGMRSAMLRGGEDSAPQMQRIQDMGDYVATGRPARGKPPMQGPYPGSALVPPSVLAAQAGAEANARARVEKIYRETPEEAAAKAAAIARVNATAEAEKKAREKLPARKQVSTLLNKIRNAYNELDKAKAIPSETRNMAVNAMDYFATTPLGREGQKMLGTASSKYLSEIVNSRKLLATAVKNAAGMTAQEMNSNVELQLTLDALTDPTQGIEAARSTINTLEELYGVPGATGPLAGISPLRRSGGPQYKAPQRNQPAKGGAVDRVYDPATGKLK